MISKIFQSEYLKRLDNIKQWAEIDTFKEESVSQHSYKVVVFGRILLEDIFGFNKDPKILSFKLACIDAFMFHDWDEALILRDISHETKYNEFNGDQIRSALNSLSTHIAMNEFFESYNGDEKASSPSSDMITLNIVRQSADVKLICKLADWISLCFYMKREMYLGNRGIYKKWIYSKNEVQHSLDAVKNMLKSRFVGYDLNFNELDNLILNIYGEAREANND